MLFVVISCFRLRGLRSIRSGLSLFLVALFLASRPASAEPLNLQEIKELLARAAAARGSGGMTADYAETRKVAMLKEPIREEGRLAFSPPNLFRKEALQPRRVIHSSDGTTLWIVFPDDQKAEKYPLKASRSLADSFQALASALRLMDLDKQFELTGERVANGYELQLTPRQRSLKSSISAINVALTPALTLQRISVIAPDGNQSTLTLSNEKPTKLELEDFQFTPASGMQVSAPMGE